MEDWIHEGGGVGKEEHLERADRPGSGTGMRPLPGVDSGSLACWRRRRCGWKRLSRSSLSTARRTHLARAPWGALTSALRSQLTLAALTTWRAWSSLAGWTHRAVFVFGELSVGVLIELFQRLGRLGDLNGIDDAVLVGVECFDERAHRALNALGAWCTCTARMDLSTGSGLGGRLGRWRVLGDKWKAGGSEAQGDEDAGWFHDGSMLVGPSGSIDDSRRRSTGETLRSLSAGSECGLICKMFVKLECRDGLSGQAVKHRDQA